MNNTSIQTMPPGLTGIPPPDNPVQVVCLVGLGSILFATYVVVLILICIFKKDFNHSYYTLTFGLGVSDLLNLFFISLATLESFFNNYEFDYTFGKSVSVVTQGIGWYGSFYLNLAIAVNRLVAITMFQSYPKIFKIRTTRLLVLLCYTIGICYFIPFCVVPKGLCDRYDRNVPRKMPNADLVTTYLTGQMAQIGGCCVALILIYVTAAAVSAKRLKNLNVNRKKYVKEVKMLAQGCLGAMLMCVVGITMYLGTTIVGPYITKIFHTFYTGSNPIIYLLLDGKLRKRFFYPAKLMSSTALNQVTPN